MAETPLETLVYSVAFCAVVAGSVAALQFAFTGGVDLRWELYAVSAAYFYFGRRSAVGEAR